MSECCMYINITKFRLITVKPKFCDEIIWCVELPSISFVYELVVWLPWWTSHIILFQIRIRIECYFFYYSFVAIFILLFWTSSNTPDPTTCSALCWEVCLCDLFCVCVNRWNSCFILYLCFNKTKKTEIVIFKFGDTINYIVEACVFIIYSLLHRVFISISYTMKIINY